jgi:mono/diheme cytochrome c family protein
MEIYQEDKIMLHHMKLFTLIVSIFTLTLFMATDSFAEHGNAEAGRAVFDANCAICHGADGNSPLAAA